MKKIFLPLLMVLGISAANAQTVCVPGTVTAPKAGYIIPDSATNLNHACVGLPYEQIIYIKAQRDTSIVLFGLTQQAQIDSYVVRKAVTNLPPGLTVQAVPGFKPASGDASKPKTNFERLIIPGDSLACIKISGTVPTGTTPQVYTLVIQVRAYLSGLPLGLKIDTLADINYYSIDVKGTPCWPAAVSDVASSFSLDAPFPNPMSTSMYVPFNAYTAGTYNLRVFSFLGQEVYYSEMKASQGSNYFRVDNLGWANGMYLFTLSNNEQTRSGKFSIQR
jgi:hypothetical protein